MPSAGFNSGALKAFEAELTQAVIPFVEKNYRVRKEPDSRALAGLSMGGIHVRSSWCIQFRMAALLSESCR